MRDPVPIELLRAFTNGRFDWTTYFVKQQVNPLLGYQRQISYSCVYGRRASGGDKEIVLKTVSPGSLITHRWYPKEPIDSADYYRYLAEIDRFEGLVASGQDPRDEATETIIDVTNPQALEAWCPRPTNVGFPG